MPELGSYGSVRGAAGNSRPYREQSTTGEHMCPPRRDGRSKTRLAASMKAGRSIERRNSRGVKLDAGNSRFPAVTWVNADKEGEAVTASLQRPGGNLTGLITSEASFKGKRLGLFTEIAPGVRRVAMIFNPDAAPFVASFHCFQHVV
jgi:ABC transporter substrate binding protein